MLTPSHPELEPRESFEQVEIGEPPTPQHQGKGIELGTQDRLGPEPCRRAEGEKFGRRVSAVGPGVQPSWGSH